MPVNFVFEFYADKRSMIFPVSGVIKEASKRNRTKFGQAPRISERFPQLKPLYIIIR